MENGCELSSNFAGATQTKRRNRWGPPWRAPQTAHKRQRAESLRPFSLVTDWEKQLDAESPAQRLKTNQGTAQQHDGQAAIRNPIKLLRKRGGAGASVLSVITIGGAKTRRVNGQVLAVTIVVVAAAIPRMRERAISYHRKLRSGKYRLASSVASEVRVEDMPNSVRISRVATRTVGQLDISLFVVGFLSIGLGPSWV